MKIQDSSLTIIGHDASLFLTATAGRPGWYILQLQAAQLKWDLEDSKLILFRCTKISLTFFHLTLLDLSEVIAKWNT